MRTQTAAADKHRRTWQIVCESEAQLLVRFRCLRTTIRTLGSFMVVTRDSSSRSWRMLSHEVSRSRSADLAELTKSGSCYRTEHRPGGGLGEPLSGSRIRAPTGRQESAPLRAQPAAFCPLVGKHPSHRRRLGTRSH